MKTKHLPRRINYTLFFFFIIFLIPAITIGQVVRSYGSVYSNTIRGGHVIFGNTITAIYTNGSGSTGTINTTYMNDFSLSGTGNYTYGRTSAYGNDNNNIQLVDVDGVGATASSSSADLVLPAGTNTIKFARLYWGGRIHSGEGGAGNINLRSVKIRKGTGAYTPLITAATQVDKVLVSGSASDTVYQAYADVTAIVTTGGAGSYTIADMTVGAGTAGNGGHFGGWAIVVVYENQAMPYFSVRVYDGFIQIYNGGNPVNQTVVLTGLNVPSDPLEAADAYMSTMSWEGDANLAASASTPEGDYLKINGVTVTNAVNPPVNMWNGTISKNGSHVTTKNPDFRNQMSIDLDEVQVGLGYGILGEATTLTVEFGTEADQYFPNLFAFSMRAKDPTIFLDKYVQDALAPYGVLQPNELLTYILSGVNNGPGAAYKCAVTDTIPSNVIYEPGSLVINSSPGFPNNSVQTDAMDGDFAYKSKDGSKDFIKFFIGRDASSSLGGMIDVGETYSVSFKVKAPANANQVTMVNNTGRINAESVTGVAFTDDGSVNIGPAGGPTPVKFISFTVRKEGPNSILRWSTSSEVKNDHFVVERSTDALLFNVIGNVRGKGTTAQTTDYQFSEPLTNCASPILYYRLRMVDIDGKNTFSNVIVLRIDGLTIRDMAVYPNPFSKNIRLQVKSLREEAITINIINSGGQVMDRRHLVLQPGENILVLNDLDNLPMGILLMQIITPGGTINKKITKN